MGNLLEDCLAVSAANMTPTWVDASFLKQQENIALPIWEDPNGASAGLLMVDGNRAAEAGLRNRPTRETARDTIEWWGTLPAERTATIKAGPGAQREAEVLALWRERNN